MTSTTTATARRSVSRPRMIPSMVSSSDPPPTMKTTTLAHTAVVGGVILMTISPSLPPLCLWQHRQPVGPSPGQSTRPECDRDTQVQLNSGFSGLGFVNPPDSVGEEAEEEFLPTVFGRKLKEGATARRECKKERKSRESERKPIPKWRRAGFEAIQLYYYVFQLE
ncbi:hypothetical protein QJS04_geneDACA007450 [Acorus gramineus]|uniref:Uncharacterized protein n=1 Tax=Acorus gramineus TaxID=55184 RepID=A0AAV9B1X4_ACOGR|nr:hypothetical protein QJS04_geneDACA007450 [Acorus gramineus]